LAGFWTLANRNQGIFLMVFFIYAGADQLNRKKGLKLPASSTILPNYDFFILSQVHAITFSLFSQKDDRERLD